MDGTSPRGTPWGGVELLERALGYTRGSLALVTPALERAPTPCAGWDLRDLLAHMDDSLTSLHEAGSGRAVAVAPLRASRRRHRSSGELAEDLRGRACTLLAEWTLDWVSDHARGNVVVGGRQITPRVLTSAGALEVAVHGWDVATACGVDRPIPDSLASDLLLLAPRLVTPEDRPARFAPALAVAETASASRRLLAYLGRKEPARGDRPAA